MKFSRTAKADCQKHGVANRPMRPARLLATTLLVCSILACAPVIDNRGYIFDQKQIDTLQKGSSSLDGVRGSFGSPTAVSSFNGQALYYIYSRFVTESYRAPEETDRQVLALYFDKDEKLKDFGVYHLEDGIIVPIVQRTTQTQGQELSALQQILSNVGRFGDGSPTEF